MRYYSKRLKRCIITPVTGFNINPALIVHLLNSLGSILARCYFRGAHMPHHATNNVRILPGTHLYTWVESSNVDKVSCWRTKSARHWRESNPELFDPESRVQSNIPRHLHMMRSCLQFMALSRIKMRTSIPQKSKCCNTDRRSAWTVGETMLKNKPHLVRFDHRIIVSLWTFQPNIVQPRKANKFTYRIIEAASFWREKLKAVIKHSLKIKLHFFFIPAVLHNNARLHVGS